MCHGLISGVIPLISIRSKEGELRGCTCFERYGNASLGTYILRDAGQQHVIIVAHNSYLTIPL